MISLIKRNWKKFPEYLLSAIFMMAAITKLFSLRDTAEVYSLMFNISFAVSLILVAILIILEVSFSLLIPTAHLSNNILFIMISLFVLLFVGANVFMILLGADNCGCFGTIIQESPSLSLIKNILVILAIYSSRKIKFRRGYV